MKKNHNAKKLTLNKTVVRVLSGKALEGVGGGLAEPVDSNCGSCAGSCGASCICSVLGCSTADPGCVVLN